MYEAYFGFTERPFDDTTDPRFFFASLANQEAFATLSDGVNGRRGLIVVTGEPGTGKSTLLRKLMHDRRANLRAAYIFNSFISFAELLDHAAKDLGLPAAAGNATVIVQLKDYLIRQLQLDNVVCLLVDEAQNLRHEILEEIRLLSNLESGEKKLLQIVLAGQPELEQKLNRPNLRQLKQRIALRCRVYPLTAREVGPYIDMRLATAGFRGNGLFSPEAVELIAACSKGTPRLVNHICDKALFHAFAASKSRISADIVKEVVRTLKLVEEPIRIEEIGVSELRRAVGEDIFRPTRKHGPVIAQDPNSPREQFDYFVCTDSDTEGSPGDPGKRKHPRLLGMGFWLLLLMTAGAAASLYLGGITTPFLRGQVEQLADSGRAGGRMPEANPTPAPEPQKAETASNTNVPSTEVIPPSEEPVKEDFAPLPEDKTHAAEDFSKSAFESAPEPVPEKTPEKRRGAKNQAGIERLRGEEKSATRELTIKIHRAIHNRAIRGVDVHVRGGTVYLGGRVATHRQRHAAIRATRSVPGVKEVRDQIAVDRTVDSNRRG